MYSKRKETIILISSFPWATLAVLLASPNI
jgi:hypothetical protein